MKEKVTKAKIIELFSKAKTADEVRKIKKLAMHNQIKLGKLRKLFCKKCYGMNLKTLSIKKGIKRVECEDCGFVMRWRI